MGATSATAPPSGRTGARLPPGGARAASWPVQFGVWGPPAWRWVARTGAGDEEIMSIAGHVSRAMLSRYSHVRMEAKRRALDEIAARQGAADEKRKAEAERREQASTTPVNLVARVQ